jgi:eukaryotic-like serine/threonine-protein kinase
VVAGLSDTKGLVSDKKLLPDIYFLRALANAQLGRFSDALADYDKTVKLAPKNAGSLNNSAWLLATCADAKFRDPARAVQLAKKAVQLSPKEGTLWNTLGVARYRAGEWQSAIDAIKKSTELRSGGDSFDWFCLAMAHWQLAKTGVTGQGSEVREEKADAQGRHRAGARKWYDQAVMWMEKNNPKDEELRRFRTEAAELMGIEKTKTTTTKDTKSTRKKPS